MCQSIALGGLQSHETLTKGENEDEFAGKILLDDRNSLGVASNRKSRCDLTELVREKAESEVGSGKGELLPWIHLGQALLPLWEPVICTSIA